MTWCKTHLTRQNKGSSSGLPSCSYKDAVLIMRGHFHDLNYFSNSLSLQICPFNIQIKRLSFQYMNLRGTHANHARSGWQSTWMKLVVHGLWDPSFSQPPAETLKFCQKLISFCSFLPDNWDHWGQPWILPMWGINERHLVLFKLD